MHAPNFEIKHRTLRARVSHSSDAQRASLVGTQKANTCGAEWVIFSEISCEKRSFSAAGI
jgi:hypothetical protein